MKSTRVLVILAVLIVALICPVFALEYTGYDRVTLPYDNSTFMVPATGNEIVFVTNVVPPSIENYAFSRVLEIYPGNTTFYLIDKENNPSVYTYQYSYKENTGNTNDQSKALIDSILEALGYGTQ